MNEQPPQSAQASEPERNAKGDSKRREDPFPPKLFFVEKLTLFGISYPALVLASLYLLDQLCFGTRPSSLSRTYVAFAILLTLLLIDRLIRHKLFAYKARLEDASEVEALFVEADTVEPRLDNPKKPDNYGTKKEQLDGEVKRLKGLGYEGWTEYQVLSLSQMLIDFLKIDELIARAHSTLNDLEEYAEDTTNRYDIRLYYRWRARVEESIEKIEESDRSENEKEPEKRDQAAEPLRAQLKTLLEHVANYQSNWAEGSEYVRSVTKYGVAAIPILIAMGLLPAFHTAGNGILGIFNWSLLGIAGSLTAVLLNLRKSNLVDVGDTEARKELWNAILGAVLGLVAGLLAYCMISGGILSSGSVVPDVKSKELPDMALSILWAVASGFYFERIFDRMRSMTLAESS